MADELSSLKGPVPADSRAALERTIALLEATLEASHDGILVVDLNRRISLFNAQFLRMFGFTAEQLQQGGLDWVAATLGEQLEHPDVLLSSTDRTWEDPVVRLDLMPFRDGRVFERFIAPHRLRSQAVGVVISYRDISESVRTKDALEQHRAFLEKAQEVAHIGSWVAELTSPPRIGWSMETYRMFGVPLNGFAGTAEAFFEFVHEDDRYAVRKALAAAIAEGKPFDIEHRMVRADGQVRWVHERADLVVGDAGGGTRRMIGAVQDVTERRRLEEQLRQSQKLEAVGRLAGGVAHDLNNALTAIVGYTELAMGALGDGDPVRADVQEIRRAAERAEAVTRQLLAFSRKQMLEPKVFPLQDAVANLARLLERLLGTNITLTAEVAQDVPPIYGDPGQIEQAILNLAVNARDAMPKGGRLTLSLDTVDVDEAFARTHQPMAQGRYVQLAVADTGEGMSPETQAHVFEPFFTTKEVGKGTGLGLPMVYGTVKQSGGFIFMESTLGQGTTFRLYFPPVQREPGASQPQPTAGDAARDPTILVVEDEPAVRRLVVTSLARPGTRVLQAASAEDALAVASVEPQLDLLLTDANMPGMSGQDLAARLLRERPRLTVVIMSGYTEDALGISRLPQPVSILLKPFTPKELRQKVSEVLARRASG